jgi:hypothetical protein
MVNKSYDNVAKFESLGTTLTNQKIAVMREVGED